MAKDHNTDETVELPEDQPIDEPDRKTGLGRYMTPNIRFSLLAVAGLTAIAAAIFMTGSEQSETSRVRSPPQLDATPGGAVQVESPAFQEASRRANEEGAARAEREGRSFAPVLEAQFEPLEEDEPPEEAVVETVPDEPVAEPRVVERRILPNIPDRFSPPPPAPREEAAPDPEPEVTQVVQQANEENRFTAGILSNMGRVSREMSISGMETQNFTPPDRDEPENGAGDQDDTERDERAVFSPDELLLKPGDIMYAQTITSVSSDAPSPVLARVVSGDLRDARLVGAFQVNESANAMVVSFSQMTLPDGRTLAIDAFAVDARSAETAVASDVEHRFIARYAPILASSFIAGYAESAAQPSQRFAGETADSLVIRNAPSAANHLFSGLAEAASAVSQDILRNAPSGPRVNLRSGHGIGVLVVEPVIDPDADR